MITTRHTPSSLCQRTLVVGIIAILLCLPSPRAVHAQTQVSGATFTDLYDFTSSNPGPQVNFIQASDGNFYTSRFVMTPAGVVTWFNDATWSAFALTQGVDGNFYGIGGGQYLAVFSMTPLGVSTALYEFTGGADSYVNSSLVQGSDGNFYGTTAFNSAFYGNLRTIYSVTPSGFLTTLVSDPNGGSFSGVMQASDGNYYGLYDTGNVFRMTPAGALSPVGNQSIGTSAGLTVGPDGNLYGLTGSGLFSISTGGTVTQLASIGNGNQPTSQPVFDVYGNFYATQFTTTRSTDVYMVSPTGNVGLLYEFPVSPYVSSTVNGVIVASDGNLYGTTFSGGQYGYGEIFKITPSKPDPPQNLTTAVSGGSVQLSWNPAPVATSYNIYRSTTITGGYSIIGSASTTQFIDAAPVAGNLSYYYVTAVNAYGESGPSGGASSAPVPAITLLSPSVAHVGDPTTVMTVTGSGFLSTSVVEWNGTALATGFTNSLTLTATIPASDLATQGTDNVDVSNAADLGYKSKTAAFNVTPNATPVLTSLNPPSLPVGSPTTTITINGSNFISSSVAAWNGTPLSTTVVDANTIHAAVPAQDMVVATTASITVVTPNAAAGNTLTFNVVDPVPTLASLSPTSSVAAFSVILMVTGTNFVPNSVVNFNGTPLATVYNSPTQLHATIPSTDMNFTGLALITVTNPAPGGGTTGGLTFTVIANPLPAITSLAPSSVAVGSPATAITVKGSNFLPSSQVAWKGTAIATTFVDSGTLTATIPAIYLAVAGTAAVTVTNPTPGGGRSNSLTFNVTSPVPTISSISPTGVDAGAPNTVITLTGMNFELASAVNWNGSPLATAYVSSTTLNATVPAANLSQSGIAQITVTNPAPGGGTTSGQNFTVTPVTPNSLSAQAGNASVHLSWGPSAGATSYNVYRGTSYAGEAPTPIASGITGTSYLDTGLTNGITYFYHLTAVSSYVSSSNGNEASATPVAPPPVPTGLSAVAGNTWVSLTWTASPYATSYSLYRGTSSFGQSTTPIATGVTGTAHSDVNLTNGTTYYYRVAAFDSSGHSAESNQAAATPVAPPLAPTNLTASPANAKAVLTWTASANATSYNVYRGTTSFGQSATPVATGIVGTTYTDAGLTNGTTYFYRVAAFNGSGHSAEGNQTSATPIAPPPTPTGLTATAGTGSVTLNWTASAGATSYNVYRGTTSFGQSATPVATGVVGTTYTDTGLTHGTTYYYRIAAFNSSGHSAEGNQAGATP